MSSTTSAGSVRHALGAATDALNAAAVDDARRDAELLLAEALGWGRAHVAASPDFEVPASAARRFGEMLRARLRRQPVAYILGRKGFRRIELLVDPRALIPRPETELLVDAAVELAPETVLDVGTGSGAVALAVADELPEAEIVATDASEAALDLAHANASRLGFSDRVRFEPGTLPPGEGFGLVLANLPYVSESEWEGLAPEIVQHEPREALVSGPTGLEAIASLVKALGRGEVLCGAVGLEVGAGQASEVAGLLAAAGFAEVETRKDLAGIERVVLAQR